MPIQTNYSYYHQPLLAGMINSVNPWNAVSKLNKTAAALAFGKGVVADGTDGAKLPATGATLPTFIGVVKRELNRAYPDADLFNADGTDKRIGVPITRDATVVTAGRIAVVAAVDVAQYDPVSLVLTGDYIGDFSNTGGLVITGAKWLTTTTAGNVGEISLVLGG